MQSGNLHNVRLAFKRLGFTLVELLVVLTIIALLLSIASPRYFSSIDRAKEATLKQTLNVVRDALDKFYADKGLYPEALEDLVEQRYINKIPVDPVTDSSETWEIVPPEDSIEGEVYNIKSGATGKAKDGSNYADW